MLSDEEKQVVDYLIFHKYENSSKKEDMIDKVIEIIEKQSKEIEELNKSDVSKEQSSMNYYNLYKELVDKIKAKIEEQDETKQYWTDEIKDILKSLLRKEQ